LSHSLFLLSSRITATKAVLYRKFPSFSDFEDMVRFATQLGVLVHSSKETLTLVVAEAAHEEMKRYWQERARK
jgi:UDP-N-acetylglucosamine enolpyruvyl transferase